MRSKELQGFRKICKNLNSYEFTDEYKENRKLIEKALKALKIIKETPIFAWYVTIYKNAYEMIADRPSFRITESADELDKKFNLLEEVLK